jgi:hypothetical protein
VTFRTLQNIQTEYM